MGNDFGENVKEAVKFFAPFALAVSYITPLAAITVPATAVAGVVGAGTAIHGIATNNEKTRKVGADILEVVSGSMSMDATGKTEGNNMFKKENWK